MKKKKNPKEKKKRRKKGRKKKKKRKGRGKRKKKRKEKGERKKGEKKRRLWWNWKTRLPQKQLPYRACRFESDGT